ncbi:MAG TPA: DNA-deoxyinosine glycosylase [Burkholderiaceae bacterium]|nr:DNA-deoxyinosine glycosylase [Burkholderiaceae bacterium]
MKSATATSPLVCFPPVINKHTSTLILGSFPGEASLQAQQYYAHPRNQFWRLLSAVLGEDLVELAYAARLNRLLTRNIGLWDVLGACSREGSLDSAIRNAQANDFSMLKQHCPALIQVCFNGKTSGKFAANFAAAGFQTLILPSSSPANAQLSFDEKLHVWRGIIC